MEGKREGRVGDDGNMAEPGEHLARKALRRRKPQAAGVNARPTLWLGMGGDTEAAANRPAWRQGKPARQQRAFRPARSDLRERVGV